MGDKGKKDKGKKEHQKKAQHTQKEKRKLKIEKKNKKMSSADLDPLPFFVPAQQANHPNPILSNWLVRRMGGGQTV